MVNMNVSIVEDVIELAVNLSFSLIKISNYHFYSLILL